MPAGTTLEKLLGEYPSELAKKSAATRMGLMFHREGTPDEVWERVKERIEVSVKVTS